MIPIKPPACLTCRHLGPDWTCTAFRDGIPGPIIAGENDHREPYPGDSGVRYEPMEKAEPD